ncbi:MAG TPA: FixH family protein [Herpetosiphonaceae bacterium]
MNTPPIQRWIQDRRWRWLPGLLLLLLLLIPLTPVSAHAELIGSDPADGEVLATPPSRVHLQFSEPIEREFFTLEVYTADRVRVDGRDARIPADDVAALEASVTIRDPGTYTVVWRVLSIDGHVVRGVFAFSVGAAAGTGPLLDLASSGAPVEVGALVRWLTYLSAFLLVGGLAFGPLILAPAVRASGITDAALLGRAIRRWRWLGWLALLFLFGLSLAALLVQAADATGVPLGEVLRGRAISRLLTTTYGTLWLVRLGCLIGLVAVLAILTAQTRVARWTGWAGALLGAAMLLTIAASGHARAVPNQTVIAVAADWLHLVAGAIWIGGLAQLVLALPALLPTLPLPQRRALLGQTVRRFSLVAGASVVVLVATGLYAGLVHVPSWQAMLDTVYGAVLSGKLLLILPLLLLGAINLLVFHRRFIRGQQAAPTAAEDTRGQQLFGLVVRGEILLAVLILAVTGLLSGLPPATTEAPEATPFTATQPLGALQATLSITPNQAGTNELVVAVADAAGQPAPVDSVVVTVEHQDMDMGQREIPLEPAAPGQYRASGNSLSMAGAWQATVRVEQPDQAEQTAAFDVTVGSAPGSSRPLFSPARLVWNALTPVTIIGVAALVAATLIFVQRPRFPTRRARREAGWIAVVLLIVGIFGTSNGLATAYLTTQPPSVPATAASIARGREVYAQNCVACHGPTGLGDGPAAATLNPRPANLQEHLAQGHTDQELYSWISEGITGTGMPAFKERLSDEDIWNVINAVRTFVSAPAGGS